MPKNLIKLVLPVYGEGPEDFALHPFFPLFGLRSSGVKENGKCFVKLSLQCGL